MYDWHAVLLAAFLTVSSLRVLALAPAAADLAVVVHPDVPVSELSFKELRKVLLGDREFWSPQVRVTLLIRAPVAWERDLVLKNIYQMSESQFRQYWIGKVFRAEIPSGPKIVYTGDMAIQAVGRIPGAITFVDASRVGEGLKVVRIDGRLPGERGYLLR